MNFSVLPQPVGLLKLILNMFCTIFKGEISADLILWNVPVLGHLWTDFYQTWYDAKHDQTLLFVSSLNYLDVHLRSQES